MTDGGSRDRSGQAHVLVLDGLRGIAALGVAIFHVQAIFGDRPILPNGILAVSFFFTLSGFVLSYAYETRLTSTLTVGTFMALRIIRLYPMSSLGMLLGFLVAAQVHPEHLQLILSQLLVGVTLLPWTGYHRPGDSPWPLDAPCWSLFSEVIASGIFAVSVPRMSNRLLASMTIFLAFVAAYLRFCQPSSSVLLWSLSSLPNTLFCFGTGVLIARLYIKRALPHIPLWLALIALIAPLTILGDTIMGQLISTWFIFPAIVTFSASTPVINRYIRAACSVSGKLSYPLYAIHYPIFLILQPVSRHFHMGGRRGEFLTLMVASLGAWVVLKTYDEPLRSMLSRKLFAGRQNRPSPAHA
jgi:peptidoglycan/LPS O-acetylase OafA/YrhL